MEQSDLFGFLKGLPVFAWIIIGVLAAGILFSIAKKLIKIALLFALGLAIAFIVARFLM